MCYQATARPPLPSFLFSPSCKTHMFSQKMSSTSYAFVNCASFLDIGAAKEIDESQGSCVHDVVEKIHTFQMEYDPDTILARLPNCFVREFGNLVDTHVLLQDPNGNEIQVNVIKKCNDMFFGQGWLVLRDVYDIWFGGWLSFTYVSPNLLRISVTTRWGTEVKYPLHDPPIRHMLARTECDPKVQSSSNGSLLPVSFVRSYLKKLNAYDVHYGTLVLPWYGFGESSFAFTFTNLVLVDHLGVPYPCIINFAVDGQGELACKVSGGWADFCRRHNLVEGNKVRFAVNQPAFNYVMYVCVYPQIGIETTLSYPLADGSYLPLYVS